MWSVDRFTSSEIISRSAYARVVLVGHKMERSSLLLTGCSLEVVQIMQRVLCTKIPQLSMNAHDRVRLCSNRSSLESLLISSIQQHRVFCGTYGTRTALLSYVQRTLRIASISTPPPCRSLVCALTLSPRHLVEAFGLAYSTSSKRFLTTTSSLF